MRIASGTLIGPYHVNKGLPNQDSFRTFCSDDSSGLTVLAVADGAGSLERSDEGSRIAVDDIIDHVRRIYTEISDNTDISLNLEEILSESFGEVVKTIHGMNDREIGSTLIVFVSDSMSWVCGTVGDSFGVLKNRDGSFELLKADSTAEFANQTVLLTSDTVNVSVFSGRMDEISGVALTSDGLENSTVTKKTEEPVKGFWNVVFSKNENGILNVDELLDYMSKAGKLDDDTTLVVASFGDEDSEGDTE